MERDSFTESAWRRAKCDTIAGFGTIRFWLFDGIWTVLLTVWVLLWIPPCIKDEGWKIVYQVLIPFVGAVLGLGVLFIIYLILAPYRQRKEARTALLKGRKGIPKVPAPQLRIGYQILSVYPNNIFDCRVFVKNVGTDLSRFTKVIILFNNLDIVTILWGECQRIDDLRKVPAIQWDYDEHVIHPTRTLKIADLKLRVKVADQTSFVKSEMIAENMGEIYTSCVINIGELEIMKSKIDQGQDVFLVAAGAIPNK